MLNELNVLHLVPEKVDLVYDELDTNAANFVLPNGYFSVQAGVYLEEDEQLNEPFFELNEQAQGQLGGLKKVTFSKGGIGLEFKDDAMFLGKYQRVVISLKTGVERELVDFFVNHLFLGEMVEYASDFPNEMKCAMSVVREPL